MMMKNMNSMRVVKGGIRERNSEQSNRQRYQLHYTRYIQTQFTYNTHNLLKRICENGQKQPYMYGIPLYKIMLQVVKIMMMNELQTLFLGSTLQQMKWKINDPCLNQYVGDAIDITPNLDKDLQARRVQFSLLLISYIVKMYLNDDLSLFDFKIRDIIRTNFDKMYQVWVNKVQSNNWFRFNPKNMNRIFNQYDTHPHENNLQITDYNKLVTQYFRQSDSSLFEEREQEIIKHQEEPYKPMYSDYHHDQANEVKELQRKNTPKFNQRRNDINQLPMEEEEEVPQSSQRRQSLRLSNRVSEIGLFRRESGNQFFAPENSRGGIFNLNYMRSSKNQDDLSNA